MTDYMKPGVISDLLRTVLTTIIDRPAFFILGVVYAILVFLVPQLVTLVMNVVAIGADKDDQSINTQSWANCWNNAYIINK